MKILLLVPISLCILMSCANSHAPQGDNTKEPISWQTLTIESRGQTITIDKYLEYGVRDTCDFEELIINESIIEYNPINRGRQHFEISQNEKDLLFDYIYDIVTNPVDTEQFATCYVGNISIGFSTGNTTLICKYNSVGNWTTISPSTSKLYSLLKDKTRISEH